MKDSKFQFDGKDPWQKGISRWSVIGSLTNDQAKKLAVLRGLKENVSRSSIHQPLLRHFDSERYPIWCKGVIDGALVMINREKFGGKRPYWELPKGRASEQNASLRYRKVKYPGPKTGIETYSYLEGLVVEDFHSNQKRKVLQRSLEEKSGIVKKLGKELDSLEKKIRKISKDENKTDEGDIYDRLFVLGITDVKKTLTTSRESIIVKIEENRREVEKIVDELLEKDPVPLKKRKL